MISQELYNEKMKKMCLFTGQRITNEAVNTIYDEIKANYTNKDFQLAIDDLMVSEQYKITGPVLVKRLNYHRYNRYEQESNDRKKKEEADTKKFWEREYELGCTDHKCFSCQRTRCDDMAHATMAYIKDILRFEPDITLSVEDQKKQKIAYRLKKKEKLITDFPGAGFEKEYPRQTGIYLDELQGKNKRQPGKEYHVKTSAVLREPTEIEQTRWEADYYGEEFVPEGL